MQEKENYNVKKKNHALKPQAHLQERGLYTSAVYSGLQTLDSTRQAEISTSVTRGSKKEPRHLPCPRLASDNQVSAWMAACGQVF